MTITYDPSHPKYYDEGDFRAELLRVYDLCHGCRMCVGLCPSFPTLFDAVDARDGKVHELSIKEQDKVVSECFQCKICYVKCPYIPPHEWELDFPRLMMRANAIRVQGGKKALRQQLTDQVLARTDALGKLSSLFAPIVNTVLSKRSSLLRKAMEVSVGVSSERLLPPYARTRFSTWFRDRFHPVLEDRRARITIFPTCFIEYMEPEIGKDLVDVYERNGIECSLADKARCCGAPWLHSGNVERFRAVARKNVEALIGEVSAGKDVIVAQPTCAYVLKKDYPLYLGTEEATLVAAHSFDASEYLVKLAKSGGGIIMDFEGEIPLEVTYHAACHLQAQNIGLKGRDLIKMLGVKVNVVSKCSGIDGTWGYRAENYGPAKKIALSLGKAISKFGSPTIVGDCHLANKAIEEEVGIKVEHPMQILAKAYSPVKER